MKLDDEDLIRVRTGFRSLYVRQQNFPPLLAGPRENPECKSIIYPTK
jgi:hypothetical protein